MMLGFSSAIFIALARAGGSPILETYSPFGTIRDDAPEHANIRSAARYPTFETSPERLTQVLAFDLARWTLRQRLGCDLNASWFLVTAEFGCHQLDEFISRHRAVAVELA